MTDVPDNMLSLLTALKASTGFDATSSDLKGVIQKLQAFHQDPTKPLEEREQALKLAQQASNGLIETEAEQ